jgi:DegV family protein with EDD domain
MNRTIRIVTDSSCDLPPALLHEHEIEVVPLSVHFGTDVYYDGELSRDEFWEKASGSHLPNTSQPAVGAFEQVFERLVTQGNQILCLTITGKHSGTFNSARLAGESFGDAVTVFDSHSLSLGLGVQALVAAQAAHGGQSMPDIILLLEDLRPRTRLLIVLDTLEYLQHGGRANAFMAAAERMTRAMNIKLIVNLVDGRLRLLGPARSFESALKRVLDLVDGLGALEYLAVAHALRPALADEMAGRLAKRTHFPQDRIWVRETGAVLASHAGPGVIGVLAVPFPQRHVS